MYIKIMFACCMFTTNIINIIISHNHIAMESDIWFTIWLTLSFVKNTTKNNERKPMKNPPSDYKVFFA